MQAALRERAACFIIRLGALRDFQRIMVYGDDLPSETAVPFKASVSSETPMPSETPMAPKSAMAPEPVTAKAAMPEPTIEAETAMNNPRPAKEKLFPERKTAMADPMTITVYLMHKCLLRCRDFCHCRGDAFRGRFCSAGER